ncbi:hypothetical protein [Fodinibius sp.]|uniref:hypothetical protein n=1 Tax=Fodinibius sp. TaxID=1872440 RepID=UPI002ACDBE6A|nr:hypothetical protein [Fodinibius sp.]MDZ7659452.1 hypothetical protein [Fodinibius sp.]
MFELYVEKNVDGYMALDDNEQDEYRRRYPEEVEMVSTFAERFKEQGLQQGLQEGMQQGLDQGKQQGEAAVLLRLLERKFGAAALAPHRARVERADADTLLVWSERILTASSIEEVLGE